MNGSDNRIYGSHMIIHNGQFVECEVLENFQGFCGPRSRTCKLDLKDPRGQRLTSMTTTLVVVYMFNADCHGSCVGLLRTSWNYPTTYYIVMLAT